VDESSRSPDRAADGEPLPELPEGYAYVPDAERGMSEHGRLVAKMLTMLGRSARSLGFYSPTNRALQMFFDGLEADAGACLGKLQAVTLAVDPVRFTWEGEVVHEDTDRERSLPFKLYRDGVRTLTLREGTTRDELLELARILGQRMIGVHSSGEDVVTRLWKADFQHVEYDVSEGFVQAEPGAGGGAAADVGAGVAEVQDRIRGRAAGGGAGGEDLLAVEWLAGAYPGREHYDLDLRSAVAVVDYPEISFEEFGALREELDREAEDLLPRLVDDLARVGAEAAGLLDDDVLFALVDEGRRHLLSEARLGELTRLVEVLGRLAVDGSSPGRQARARAALDALATAESLRDAVSAAPADGEGPWDLRVYLRSLGESLEGDALLRLLRFEVPLPLRRALLDQLLETCHRDAAWFAGILEQEKGPALDRLTALDALVMLDGDEAREALYGAARHEDPQVRLHLLGLLEVLPDGERPRRAVARGLRDQDDAVRDAALALAARRPHADLADALMTLGDRPGFGGWEADARRRLVEAAAACDPAVALGWIRQHVAADKMWVLLTSEQKAWNEVAPGALAIIGGGPAAILLRKMKDRGPDEMRERALRAYLELDRRRREGGGAGEGDGA